MTVRCACLHYCRRLKTVWIRQLIVSNNLDLNLLPEMFKLHQMHSNENKIGHLWFCCHMLSGKCQAGPYLYRSYWALIRSLNINNATVILWFVADTDFMLSFLQCW